MMSSAGVRMRRVLGAALFAWSACSACSACSGGGPRAPVAEPAPSHAGGSPSSVPAGKSDQTGDATSVEVPATLRAVVDAADREAEDKALDAGRHPAELLAFAGVKPGMKVAEIAAGGGYTAELLARAVGPTGVVYGQNSPWILEKFADKPWTKRLAKPVNKTIVKVTRELDDPLPPEAKDLDAVFCVLFYHDTFWLKADRKKMNAAIARALKPGGVFIVVDHSGRSGTGSSEVQSLHRIEESVVRAEIEEAGLRLAAQGSFLRNAQDKRDWNAAPFAAAEKRGTSDRFVLRFVKP